MARRSKLSLLFERLGELERPCPADSPGGRFCGVELDSDLCGEVAKLLGSQDLAALGSCSAAMQLLAAQTYPGLKLGSLKGDHPGDDDSGGPFAGAGGDGGPDGSGPFGSGAAGSSDDGTIDLDEDAYDVEFEDGDDADTR